MTPASPAVLERVARAMLELPAASIVRVGIDGVDGAGKTTFADELADVLVPSSVLIDNDDLACPFIVRPS
jgi:uridine kinase